jgi:uncharacterized protein (DUF952 family)
MRTMKNIAYALILGSMMEMVYPAMSVESLYKVVPLENWEASQSRPFLKLADEDNEFIHFSTEEQLNRITEKYWSNVPQYIILKVDMKRVPGKLVLEANPGGANKYYHLYDGCIPLEAILEVKTVRN